MGLSNNFFRHALAWIYGGKGRQCTLFSKSKQPLNGIHLQPIRFWMEITRMAKEKQAKKSAKAPVAEPTAPEAPPPADLEASAGDTEKKAKKSKKGKK